MRNLSGQTSPRKSAEEANFTSSPIVTSIQTRLFCNADYDNMNSSECDTGPNEWKDLVGNHNGTTPTISSNARDVSPCARQRAMVCKRNLFNTNKPEAKENYTIDSSLGNTQDHVYCENTTDITGVLDQASMKSDLIGDYSRAHILPLVQGKHADLKTISPQTMAAVLRGNYDAKLGHVVVVDCRYPFEYEGGHIEGALNLYTREAILDTFIISDDHRRCLQEVPTTIIFHCEFSSERGPKMLRYLREQDRCANSHSYPSLHFPEIYLLEGGYKAFWEELKGSHCNPVGYVPMLQEGHTEEVKMYRASNKSKGKGSKRQRSRKLQCIVGTDLAAATRTLDF